MSMNYGVNLGATLVSRSGKIGGSRNVFVKLQGGAKDDLVFPTFGGQLKNPFKTKGKIFAGDLLEFRTDANGLNPAVYLLKTFKVAAAVEAAATIVTVVRDGFHHVPCVGDILMVAPNKIGGTGTAVTVTAVEVVGETWKLTLSATLGAISKDAILVEAEQAGSSKAMLVKAINAVAPCDYDLFYEPATGDDDYDGARYMITPALHSVMYTNKMSPIPACVLAVNKSAINGWFEI